MELAIISVEAPSDPPVGEMTDSEMLRELVRTSRETRDLVTKVIGDFENSALGQMLKGGGKVNLMQLMMGK